MMQENYRPIFNRSQALGGNVSSGMGYKPKLEDAVSSLRLAPLLRNATSGHFQNGNIHNLNQAAGQAVTFSRAAMPAFYKLGHRRFLGYQVCIIF